MLAVFIPRLEVPPTYRGQTIGLELARRMRNTLSSLYAVGLICDADKQPYYRRFDMKAPHDMRIRHDAHQSGV